MRNPFYLSDIENERTLNINVLNKIPTTLTYLEFEGCFSGTIERNIVSERLPNLRYFNCARGGGVMFYPDSRPTGSTQVRLNDTLTTGNNCACVGYNADVSASGAVHQNVFGNKTSNGDNTFSVRADSGAYNSANNSSWSTTSDRRIKKNITNNTTGLDKINQITVRNLSLIHI